MRTRNFIVAGIMVVAGMLLVFDLKRAPSAEDTVERTLPGYIPDPNSYWTG
jgi:hypothetical protein